MVISVSYYSFPSRYAKMLKLGTMGPCLRRHAAKEKLSISAGDGYGAWAQIKAREYRENTISSLFFFHLPFYIQWFSDVFTG